jgi:hypothetical protein
MERGRFVAQAARCCRLTMTRLMEIIRISREGFTRDKKKNKSQSAHGQTKYESPDLTSQTTVWRTRQQVPMETLNVLELSCRPIWQWLWPA